MRNARRLAGLTATALAKILRVTPTAVCAWEKGTRRPSPAMLAPLAKALKMSPVELLRIIDGSVKQLRPGVLPGRFS